MILNELLIQQGRAFHPAARYYYSSILTTCNERNFDFHYIRKEDKLIIVLITFNYRKALSLDFYLLGKTSTAITGQEGSQQ